LRTRAVANGLGCDGGDKVALRCLLVVLFAHSRSQMNRDNTVVIFDIDGTIAHHGEVVSADMRAFLQELRKKVSVALIGGSPLRQMHDKVGETIEHDVDFVFGENGLVAYGHGKLLKEMRLAEALSEEQIQALINWALRYIADLQLPVKRGTFVDFRTGLVNFSPAGRHLTKSERAKWVEYDVKHGVRTRMVEAMRKQFPAWNLDWVIGGQMGFDVFIKGWDKTFCLQYLQQFKTIHFFGDRYEEGGNDWPLLNHPRVTPHPITTETEGPKMAREVATKLFLQ
jgi:phosphomannomutase